MSVVDGLGIGTMKVVIVGAGIMGLCTAWALRRRGRDVVLLEQGAFPNPLGSSVDEHRGFRRGYGAEGGYRDMTRHALAAWGRLAADLGQSVYAETGILYLTAAQDPWLAATLDGFAAEGIAFARLDLDELRRRYPAVLTEDVGQAVLAPEAGPLRAGEIVEGLGRWLAESGTPVRTNSKVVGVDLDAAAVTLADGSRLAGDRLVVAAGPWTPKLLPAYAGQVTPSRQVLVYLEPPPDLLAAWQAMPVLADLTSHDDGIYVIPPVQGMRLKIGDHRTPLTGDPDRDRTAAAADTGMILAKARPRLRDLARFRPLETKICLYDMTADQRFLADSVGRGIVLTGFSGHGFKFGAIIGEHLAAVLAAENSPARFARWIAGGI
jgi:glycine/D-amino acid oxidase-like deaminating enzyme